MSALITPSRLGFTVPKLPTLVDEAPAGDGWLPEIKRDGYRTMPMIDAGEILGFNLEPGNRCSEDLGNLAANVQHSARLSHPAIVAPAVFLQAH
jgi:hypothetical protein